jgi:GNAT superfamily N-acetyltransferase
VETNRAAKAADKELLKALRRRKNEEVNNMIIRKAVPKDAVELAAFNISRARETKNIELVPGLITAGVKEMIYNPRMGFYLVIEMDNRIQAALTISTEWSDWRNGNFWWIQGVYVQPDYRRQGLYSVLYEHVKGLAEQESSVCGFRLYVERGNTAAQQTCQALGMVETEYQIYEELKQGMEYIKT